MSGNFIIAGDPSVYYAWPSVAKLPGGELLVVTYEGHAHTHSHGKVVLYRSEDGGHMWDQGTVVTDTILDDRDPGIVVLSDGTVIVTTRVAWWKDVDAARIDPAEAQRLMDRYAAGYLIRSTDGGRTWSRMIPYPFQPKGPVELQDGRLFAVDWKADGTFTAYISQDKGDTWTPVGKISGLPASVKAGGIDYRMAYSEPHFVQTPSGRIVTYIRAHAVHPGYGRRETGYLWLSYSDDLGETWTTPRRTDLIGYPPHACRLRDGRVLLTYGYRWHPFGQRARLSDDGVDFTKYPEIVMRADAPDDDLGYPSTIELDDGRLLTVYYQKAPGSAKPSLMGTIWTLE